MLHVDINKSHVNIIISHGDIIYLACKGQKYATILYMYSCIYITRDRSFINIKEENNQSNNAFPEYIHAIVFIKGRNRTCIC